MSNNIKLSGTGFITTSISDSSLLQGVTTSNTFLISTMEEVTIESFSFKETGDGNFIEVVKRQKPNPNFHLTYGWQQAAPKDRVFKEIYGVLTNDKGQRQLQLMKTIEGSVTPGHYVDETVEFDD